MKSCLKAMVCALAPIWCGCSAADAVDPAESELPTPGEAPAAEATVLAQVQVSASHKVKFLEYADGMVLIVEEGGIGVDTPTLNSKQDENATLVELYEQLQANATDPAASTADLQRLQQLDQQMAVARNNANHTAMPQEELVDKASSWANRGGSATLGDWTWWSTTVCPSNAYKCEVGYSTRQSFTAVNANITYLFLNEHSTLNGRQRLAWDPCYDAPFWEFCSKTYRTHTDREVAPRTWVSTFSFNNDKYRWLVVGDGPLWGWSVIFGNPRTWP